MFKHKVPLIIAVLLLIPTLITLIFLATTIVKERKAERETKLLLPFADEKNEKVLAQQITILKEKNIIEEEITSSKVAVCYVDGGSKMNYWYQKCYLRYVEGFTTSLDKATIENILQSSGRTNIHSRTCTLYAKNSKIGLMFRWKNMPMTHADALEGKIEFDCVIPDPISISPYTKHITKIYKDLDTKKINDANSKNQIWIIVHEEYYNENLGCVRSILGCENPRETPIAGF